MDTIKQLADPSGGLRRGIATLQVSTLMHQLMWGASPGHLLYYEDSIQKGNVYVYPVYMHMQDGVCCKWS